MNAGERVQLLMLRNELLAKERELKERISALGAAEAAVDTLLVTPRILTPERSTLAPLFSSEGIGL